MCIPRWATHAPGPYVHTSLGYPCSGPICAVWPSLTEPIPVVLVKVLERPAHVKARLADLGDLERTRVGELLEHEVIVPVARLERLVGLEAADVVVLGGAELLHE